MSTLVKRSKISTVFFVTVVAFTNLVGFSQSNNLDPNFGVGGVIVEDTISYSEEAHDIVIQSDGKILIAGMKSGSGKLDNVVIRYNTNGTRDNTFSTDGVAMAPSGIPGQISPVIALQSDGKIVLLCNSYNGSDMDFQLVRFNTNGTIDLSFGVDGFVHTDVGMVDNIPGDIVVQDDDKIIVVGTGTGPNLEDFLVLRYNYDGTPDHTFSDDGLVITDFDGHRDYANCVALQSDGKIVVGGLIHGNSGDTTNFFGLARYHTNGSLDLLFSDDGRQTFPGGYWGLAGLGIQSDGKIIAAGTIVNNYNNDFVVYRITTSGIADGFTIQDFGATDFCEDMVVQSNDKIILCGVKGGNSAVEIDFAVIRLNPDLNADTTFAVNGQAATDLGDSFDYGRAVAVQSDGKILVTGSKLANYEGKFATVRYNALARDPTLLDKPGFIVYPNPISDFVIIQLEVPSTDVAIKLFSLTGATVLELSSLSGRVFEIDLTGYESAPYFIEVNYSGLTEMARIIKI